MEEDTQILWKEIRVDIGRRYADILEGDIWKRMDALGDIAVAVLVVTSGNIIRMW